MRARERLSLLARQARGSDSRIVLLILDGVGDVRTENQPRTALEDARLPNLDALAARSALGRLVPVVQGITPGSGPGHLALFGYDPTLPEADIGRGVLEALGLEIEVEAGDLAIRGNFATADDSGALTDRRAGRPSTDECRRLCEKLQTAVRDLDDPEVQVAAGEGHRFVLILRGRDLSSAVSDTDPQKTGVPPLRANARAPVADSTVEYLGEVIRRFEAAIADEPQANRVLLRGASMLPDLAKFTDLYHLRAGAFAGYPLYRGVAAACGMEVVHCGKRIGDILVAVQANWDRFDFFFLHVKQTDQAGEDGNLEAKIEVLEEVDANLPSLINLEPTVLAVTGDHSTPVPMRSHSWHPVPLLLSSSLCFVDDCQEFTETAAVHGHLGTIASCELMGLLLANAGRLAKFGA